MNVTSLSFSNNTLAVLSSLVNIQIWGVFTISGNYDQFSVQDAIFIINTIPLDKEISALDLFLFLKLYPNSRLMNTAIDGRVALRLSFKRNSDVC